MPLQKLTPLCSVSYSYYQPDVLLRQEQCVTYHDHTNLSFISAASLYPVSSLSFKQLHTIVDNIPAVSSWQINRLSLPSFTDTNQIPKVISHCYLLFKTVVSGRTPIPNVLLNNAYERHLKTRTEALSALTGSFQPEILRKAQLKTIITKLDPCAQGMEVPFEQSFLKALVELERVPHRKIPKFPQSCTPVNLVLGTYVTNPSKQVGLPNLPKVTLIAGSDSSIMRNCVIQLVQGLAPQNKKIYLLDFENEFDLFAADPLLNKFQYPVRIEPKTSLNICKMSDIPNLIDIPREEGDLYSWCAFLSNLITYSSRNPSLGTNIAHLRMKLYESLNECSLITDIEKICLKDLTTSASFQDLSTILDYQSNEAIKAELCYYANLPEINASQETILETPLENGITIFQFHSYSVKLKLLLCTLLLIRLCSICDSNAVVIISNAARIFRQETTDYLQELYSELLSPFFQALFDRGSIILTTNTPSQLDLAVQDKFHTAIYFQFRNINDQEWVAAKYGFSKNESVYLTTMEGEGILITTHPTLKINLFNPH